MLIQKHIFLSVWEKLYFFHPKRFSFIFIYVNSFFYECHTVIALFCLFRGRFSRASRRKCRGQPIRSGPIWQFILYDFHISYRNRHFCVYSGLHLKWGRAVLTSKPCDTPFFSHFNEFAHCISLQHRPQNMLTTTRVCGTARPTRGMSWTLREEISSTSLARWVKEVIWTSLSFLAFFTKLLWVRWQSLFISNEKKILSAFLKLVDQRSQMRYRCVKSVII